MESTPEFGSNPFAALEMTGLSSSSTSLSEISETKPKGCDRTGLGKGERLELRREKSGRGGKTVTTVNGFPARISNKDLDRMFKELKTRLGTGGCWRENQMEVQGDKREELCEWLSAMGFKPVLAGG